MLTIKLKELREKLGYTQAYVADTLKISRVNYNRYEKGEREPDFETIKKIADFFNVSLDELIGRNINTKQLKNYLEMAPENKKIPIIGTVKCGPNGLAFNDLQGYIFINNNLHGDYIAFKCRGDSMKDLGIADGDTAIVRIQDDVECGEVAVVVINGDEGTLKRVRKFDGGIVLEAANPAYPPRIFTGADMNIVKIVGKVVQVRKDF